ncbi:Acyl CoA binding protein [seawater metagenome]|uniref:Acyl CoA binding protein n=1 Tax=seawater metagenome TaxID=1561972 RepID=A0A5E8CL67_9ZZZZ
MSNPNSQEFLNAASVVQKLSQRPGDDEMLELYSYFKQAVAGDASDDSKPGILDFKGKAKWKAWKSRAGLNKHDSECKYISCVQLLINKYGVQQ